MLAFGQLGSPLSLAHSSNVLRLVRPIYACSASEEVRVSQMRLGMASSSLQFRAENGRTLGEATFVSLRPVILERVDGFTPMQYKCFPNRGLPLDEGSISAKCRTIQICSDMQPMAAESCSCLASAKVVGHLGDIFASWSATPLMSLAGLQGCQFVVIIAPNPTVSA